MIAFTAVSKEGEHIEFAYDLRSIEAEFDFLNSLVAKGHALLSVQVLDATGRTDLPLAAFDGIPFSGAIQALQQDWQMALSQSSQTYSPSGEALIELTRQRVRQSKAIMAVHERMIVCCNQWLQRTQISSLSESTKTRLISKYGVMIDWHEHQLRQARLRSHSATNRLNALLV